MLPGSRLLSLDAFRGLTIALMVLVNTPGDGDHVYGPLRHAEWHGWTLTDCVFPGFVWIVGVALTLSLGRKLDEGVSKSILVKDIVRRAVILFVLGLLIYAVPTFPVDTFRILGVLQRIAICYAVTALIFIYTGLRGQILWTIGFMGAYWLVMTRVAAPNSIAGDFSLDGNYAHYIDKLVLGAHNYKNTKTWDPEGIISTLPAIGTCLLGVIAGHVVALRKSIDTRFAMLLGLGAALLAAGLTLNHWMPINKKLWTDSFVLLMAGLDFLVFGALFWIIDGKGVIKPFRPAMIMGMNAIAIYLSSEFLEIALSVSGWKDRIYEAVFVPLAAPINASLLFSLAYVAVHFLLAYVLYRNKLFLRI